MPSVLNRWNVLQEQTRMVELIKAHCLGDFRAAPTRFCSRHPICDRVVDVCAAYVRQSLRLVA